MIRRPPHPARSTAAWRGFTLLEIMVAVSILALMIVALLAMFHQTQRSFRAGLSQVDVMENGRAVMDLLSRELQQLAPSRQDELLNLYVEVQGTMNQPRIGGANQRNALQRYFFLSRLNDDWLATGYCIDTPKSGVGTLYRFEKRIPFTETEQLYRFEKSVLSSPDCPKNSHRVADGIVHLQLRAYDVEGRISTNSTAQGFTFMGHALPAYLDLEVGVLDSKTLEQFRALKENPDPNLARNFLEMHVGKVHLFRQRIPIRTAQ